MTKEIVEGGDDGSEPDSDFEGDDEKDHEDTSLPKPEECGNPQVSQDETGIQHPQAQTVPRVRLRLWCAFTTESVAIGYASSVDTKPRVSIPPEE